MLRPYRCPPMAAALLKTSGSLFVESPTRQSIVIGSEYRRDAWHSD